MVNPSNESHTRAARDVVMASYASIAQSTIALRVFREASLETLLASSITVPPGSSFVSLIEFAVGTSHLAGTF
jgi:hypothetical protein